MPPVLLVGDPSVVLHVPELWATVPVHATLPAGEAVTVKGTVGLMAAVRATLHVVAQPITVQYSPGPSTTAGEITALMVELATGVTVWSMILVLPSWE